MNKLRIFIALALAGAVAAASDTSTILAEIRDLKSSIEASTTEHWESLQSLRFHLLSTRKGLKTALDSIESLKSQLGQQCSGSLQPSGERGPDVHPRLRGPYQMYYDPHAATVQPLFYDERGTLQPFFIFQTSDRPWAPGSRRTSSAPWNRRWRTTTPMPSPTLRCQWPGETVGDRCLVVVSDKLLDWASAQKHCKKMNGKLAGEHSFNDVANHLNRQFGDYANPEVRWSMWAGARQTLDGWEWAHDCEGEEVDQDKWAEHQPHASSAVTHTRHCMSLDGFKAYKGVAAPCSALRRFVCDVPLQ